MATCKLSLLPLLLVCSLVALAQLANMQAAAAAAAATEASVSHSLQHSTLVVNRANNLTLASNSTQPAIRGVVIEDTASGGVLVATSKYNFALYSPALARFDWKTVTLNGKHAFITKLDNSTLTRSLDELDTKTLTFLDKLSGEFMRNLVGLSVGAFARVNFSLSDHVYGLLDTRTGARPAVQTHNLRLKSASSHSSGAPTGTGTGTGGLVAAHENTPPHTQQSAAVIKTRRQAPEVRAAHTGERALKAAGAGRNLSMHAAAGNASVGQSYTPIASPTASPSPSHGDSHSERQHECALTSGPPPLGLANYINLRSPAALGASLAGDVYYLDLAASAMDLYSASVSVLQTCDATLIYRDLDHFVAAQRNTAAGVKCVLVRDKVVMFIYADGSVLAKLSPMLEGAEAQLVHQANSRVGLALAAASSQSAQLDRVPKSALTPATPTPAAPPSKTSESQQDEHEDEQRYVDDIESEADFEAADYGDGAPEAELDEDADELD